MTSGSGEVSPSIKFELYTSSFCGACARTRAVVARALPLIPGARSSEHAIEAEPDRAESARITSTPTVVVRAASGEEVFRAAGVPTVDHLLRAAVQALDRQEAAVPPPPSVRDADGDGDGDADPGRRPLG
jgi:hypothetical protein